MCVCVFFVCFLDFSKKKQWFCFGFSRFLVLENLENPKKTMFFIFLFSDFY